MDDVIYLSPNEMGDRLLTVQLGNKLFNPG